MTARAVALLHTYIAHIATCLIVPLGYQTDAILPTHYIFNLRLSIKLLKKQLPIQNVTKKNTRLNNGFTPIKM